MFMEISVFCDETTPPPPPPPRGAQITRSNSGTIKSYILDQSEKYPSLINIQQMSLSTYLSGLPDFSLFGLEYGGVGGLSSDGGGGG